MMMLDDESIHSHHQVIFVTCDAGEHPCIATIVFWKGTEFWFHVPNMLPYWGILAQRANLLSKLEVLARLPDEFHDWVGSCG